MNQNKIITISRQYGSGGRIIGKKLAEALGIPFYDNELITMAAEKTGLPWNASRMQKNLCRQSVFLSDLSDPQH